MSMIDHKYVSTGCLHGFHDYCASDRKQNGKRKEPGKCKFCAARCLCECHQEKP